MGPTVALSVSAFSGGLLLVMAVALVIAFPRVPAARWWAASGALAALGCFQVSLLPLFEPGLWDQVELLARTALVLFSLLTLALGFSVWFDNGIPRSQDSLVRSGLWAGTFLALVPVALGVTGTDVVAWTVTAGWSGVPVVASIALLGLRGLSSPEAPVRTQSASLVWALVLGPVPFVLTWLVFPSFPGSGWFLGFPPFLVLGAVLLFRSLVHYDVRFHHHHTSPFLVEKTQDTVVFLGSDGTVQATNPALRHMLDFVEEDLVGKPLTARGADDEARRLLAPLEQLVFPDWEGTLALAHRSGRAVPVHVVFRRIHNPAREAIGAVLLFYDLRLPRRLDLTTHEDELTSLANRRWVLELLEAEFQRVKRYGGPLSVLWIEVVHLDTVQARFGSESAEEVLRRLGAILRGGLRKTDFCGRVGDREFLAVLPETAPDRTQLVSARLDKMFALSNEGEPLGVELKIGSGTLDEETESVDAFLSQVRQG